MNAVPHDHGATGTEPPPRWGEPLKFLPVIYALSTIFGLGSIYMTLHCIPLMQLDEPPEAVDDEMKQRGIIQAQAFVFVTMMVLICYARAFFTHPGRVPDDDPHWQYVPPDGNRAGWTPSALVETKKTGERRHCKWDGKYKPDRCHHCRPCKTCILKMDHHCPWIYNCVGHYNYKFFFQLLFYTVIDCHLIIWTMVETVIREIDDNAEFLVMLTVFFCETLATFIGVVLTLFFCFHVWLMLKGMTTIEFCEKSTRGKSENGEVKHFDTYDRGILNNIEAALGRNPLLWLLPLGGPVGDGLSFKTRDQLDSGRYSKLQL